MSATLSSNRIAADDPVASARPSREKLFRRTRPDYSQRLRRTIQFLFLALNVWLGVQFYLFVRYYQSGGQGTVVSRPPGVEGWLPIAGLMNLKAAVLTGKIPRAHPASLFLLLAFLAISFFFRKSFCSWLCPIGTVSEVLWKLGRGLFGRTFHLPRWLDYILRSLKYILLGLFLFAVGGMSVEAIDEFFRSPYGVVIDVRMLDFFRHLGEATAATLIVLILLSIVIQNFWCRYLCPYGALMGVVSWLSPLRIRRTPEACIDCAKCAKACPALLPVDRVLAVNSVECTGCMECVAACPAQDALDMSAMKRRRVPAWVMAVGIAGLFFGIVGLAKWSGHWQSNLPAWVYSELIPRAQDVNHP